MTDRSPPKSPTPSEEHKDMHFISVHEHSEDFELHSKATSNLKNRKRTLIDQNPHFKRSMISSMIRSTSEQPY